MRTFSDARNALKTVGFEILEENDLADSQSFPSALPARRRLTFDI